MINIQIGHGVGHSRWFASILEYSKLPYFHNYRVGSLRNVYHKVPQKASCSNYSNLSGLILRLLHFPFPHFPPEREGITTLRTYQCWNLFWDTKILRTWKVTTPLKLKFPNFFDFSENFQLVSLFQFTIHSGHIHLMALISPSKFMIS